MTKILEVGSEEAKIVERNFENSLKRSWSWTLTTWNFKFPRGIIFLITFAFGIWKMDFNEISKVGGRVAVIKRYGNG